MAEMIFRHRIAGALKISVSSAGTNAWPGTMASTGAQHALAQWKMDLSSHRSQSLTRELVDEADLIVVMTSAHRETICRQYPEKKEVVHLLHSFRTSEEEQDVADPFGLSDAAYRKTRDEIDSSISDLILTLREQGWGENSGSA